MIKGIGKAKIHKEAAIGNRKHTVAANHHNAKHSTIHVHKMGGSKRKGSKKTILK